MSEMVERVARAIAEEINGGKFDDARWYNDDQREVHRRRARIAIAAMKEPTREMEAAGDALDDWGVPSDPGTGNASALSHWHAMIDEALK